MQTVDFPQNIATAPALENKNTFHDEELGIYTIKCDRSWWRFCCNCTILTLMVNEPDSSQVPVTKPEKQGVHFPSLWFQAALRPDHLVLPKNEKCCYRTQWILGVSFVVWYQVRCTALHPLVKSFTASNLHHAVDQTLQLKVAAVLLMTAVHWTYPRFWFATCSCQLPYQFFRSFQWQKYN